MSYLVRVSAGALAVACGLYIGMGCVTYSLGYIYPYSHDGLTMFLKAVFSPFDWLYFELWRYGLRSRLWLPGSAAVLLGIGSAMLFWRRPERQRGFPLDDPE